MNKESRGEAKGEESVPRDVNFSTDPTTGEKAKICGNTEHSALLPFFPIISLRFSAIPHLDTSMHAFRAIVKWRATIHFSKVSRKRRSLLD